jgi:hypothetical protein
MKSNSGRSRLPQTLPVKSVSIGLGKILVTLKGPPYPGPLYIGALIITRVAAPPTLSGQVTPGPDQNHGSTIRLNAGPTVFDDLRHTLAQPLPFGIVLGYDSDTTNIVALDVVKSRLL